MDLCEFKTSLVYVASSRLARATYIVKPCLKEKGRKEGRREGKKKEWVGNEKRGTG